MTLQEAIEHCKEKISEQSAEGFLGCAFDHKQLLSWLEELQERRNNLK
jgi:hypothetical protein